MSRPTQAIIDLAALQHNYRLAQSLTPNARTLGVVKANAYGHGAIESAQALEPMVPAFAVACLEEAMELRNVGIKKPILLLEGPFADSDVSMAAEQNLWLMIASQEQLVRLERTATPSPIRCWVKVDTGMHRLGIAPQQLPDVLERLQALHHVLPQPVIATHFASADDLQCEFTRSQILQLRQLTEQHKLPVSLANSAGILAWPDSHGDFTRPGIMLYGASPFPHPHPITEQLQPVMSLVSAVMAIHRIPAGDSVGYGHTWTAERDSVIATVAIGYGDGYPRHARNGTPVWINGQRCPLAGRVSMDMISVDVTDLPQVQVGDAAELWGKHLPVNEVAAAAGTISYELVTRMPTRVKHLYLKKP